METIHVKIPKKLLQRLDRVLLNDDEGTRSSFVRAAIRAEVERRHG